MKNQTTEYREYPRENREHKSTLFCKVFEDKKHLLDLYNGVNHTNYQNVEDLEVNTLENVVYMTMKNDLSFLIDSSMSLYEHQSTENPNMPLRGLLYFAQLYNKYIAKHNLNLFSSTPQKIPVPQYLVFYNGTKEQPDEKILLLSELFDKKHVRQYAAADMEERETAITRAIDECIAEGILADILTEQKAEVLELVLTTFNRELYEQGLKEEAAREANEEITNLKRQLNEERQRIAELERQLEQLKKPHVE